MCVCANMGYRVGVAGALRRRRPGISWAKRAATGQSMQPFLLAIAGGSASGKSTLAAMLVERVGAARADLLSLDWYYRDWAGAEPNAVDLPNFDHPNALDLALFGTHLRQLRLGNGVDAPQYDFTSHTRRTETVRVAPRPVVIVDGILALHSPQLREFYDLSCFVSCAEALRLERRIARDVVERGRSEESVRKQFAETVAPMHDEFVEPCRGHADLVIDQDGFMAAPQTVVDRIVARVVEDVKGLSFA